VSVAISSPAVHRGLSVFQDFLQGGYSLFSMPDVLAPESGAVFYAKAERSRPSSRLSAQGVDRAAILHYYSSMERPPVESPLLSAGSGANRALLTAAFARGARAEGWPARRYGSSSSFPPGGLTDLYARAYGETISRSIGQPVLVENRAGAGGVIGCDAVAKSSADGLHAALHHLDADRAGTSFVPKTAL